jgi:AcrR family transcriptional regulator
MADEREPQARSLAPLRRHGKELEQAILDAAWEQLIAGGYESFTIEAVAVRARTSKPVLYRRWRTSDELLHAAIRNRGTREQRTLPDTGSLRGDLLELLRAVNAGSNDLAALISGMLGTYYKHTGFTPAELREEFLGNRASRLRQIIDRAVARGEIDPQRPLTPRIVDLPMALVRHELMMTLEPASEATLEEIVDDIFLPLMAGGQRAAGHGQP